MDQSYASAVYPNESGLINYTPRQLINRHIEFPEEPITKSHIENLILGNSVIPAEERDDLNPSQGKPRR